MYSVSDYCRMIGDKPRMEAYSQALRQTIRPGCIVLDIGTGTGIFALLACRLGARRVYAVEPDEAIHVGRQLAAANGCADRVEFLQKLSTRTVLPERADVIVSDMRGALPLYDQHIPAIVDARTRLLAEGGVLIPQRDTLWTALVEAPDQYRHRTGLWEGAPSDLDMGAARLIATQTWGKTRLSPEQLLVEPQCWATLDYPTIESPNVRGEASWMMAGTKVAHGLLVWFDAVLVDGIGFSNAPSAEELVYGSQFFPFTEPIALAPGDRVAVEIEAQLVDEQYIWGWNTLALEQGDPRRVKASFQQSTFFSMPLSRATLRKRAADYVPTLNEEGEIDRFILSLMSTEAQTPLGEIARELCRRFPEHFPNWEAGLTRAGTLSARYSR